MTLAVALLCVAGPAAGYRPFVSTDADVATLHNIEVELGYIGFARQDSKTTYIEPQLVLNYGFLPDFEAVGEFQLNETAHEPTTVSEGELSVKHVWREGQLQEKPGPSIATETNLLLPGSAGVDQPRVGFLQAAMLSHHLGPLTFHWNAGLGVDQFSSNLFETWGLIGECPLTRTLKAVDELNGQDERQLTAQASFLLGLIWEPGWHDAAFDVGVRWALDAVEAPLAFTTGISIPFATN